MTDSAGKSIKVGDVVQFDRKTLLLGLVEEINDKKQPNEKLWVRFLPEIYSSRRSVDNCRRTDKFWVLEEANGQRDS